MLFWFLIKILLELQNRKVVLIIEVQLDALYLLIWLRTVINIVIDLKKSKDGDKLASGLGRVMGDAGYF